MPCAFSRTGAGFFRGRRRAEFYRPVGPRRRGVRPTGGSPTPEVTWVTADGRQVTSVSGIRLVDKGEIRSVEARCTLFINIHCLIYSSLYLDHMLVHHDLNHHASPSFSNLHCSSDGRVLFHGIIRCAKKFQFFFLTDATGSVVLCVHNHSS